MPTTYNSKEKSLFFAKYRKERHDLDLRQYIEVFESECNNESTAYKAEMLLRHASEILNLYQLYLNLWTNIVIKLKMDHITY